MLQVPNPTSSSMTSIMFGASPKVFSDRSGSGLESENNLLILPLNGLLGLGMLFIAKFFLRFGEAGVIKTGEKL